MKIRRKARELLQRPKRQLDKKQRNQIIIITIIIAILIFLFFNIGKGVYESVKIHNTNKLILNQIEELYKEKQELLIRRNQIDSPKILEHEVKKALGFIKPDEKILILKEQ